MKYFSGLCFKNFYNIVPVLPTQRDIHFLFIIVIQNLCSVVAKSTFI